MFVTVGPYQVLQRGLKCRLTSETRYIPFTIRSFRDDQITDAEQKKKGSNCSDFSNVFITTRRGYPFDQQQSNFGLDLFDNQFPLESNSENDEKDDNHNYPHPPDFTCKYQLPQTAIFFFSHTILIDALFNDLLIRDHLLSGSKLFRVPKSLNNCDCSR